MAASEAIDDAQEAVVANVSADMATAVASISSDAATLKADLEAAVAGDSVIRRADMLIDAASKASALVAQYQLDEANTAKAPFLENYRAKIENHLKAMAPLAEFLEGEL